MPLRRDGICTAGENEIILRADAVARGGLYPQRAFAVEAQIVLREDYRVHIVLVKALEAAAV